MNAVLNAMRTAVGTAALFASFSALSADYPAPKEGDWVARDFRFSTGEVMPELRLHYRTIGDASGEPVLILHGTSGSGASMLTPAFAGELFGPGQPLDADQVFHHPARRDRRRQIVQALRRPARQISALQLRRHGRRAIPSGDRGPRHPPPAAGARQLDGRHAHLDLGREIPQCHGRAGADGVAAHRDVEPQLDDAAPDHRHDPQRSGLEERRLHHVSRARLRTANVFFGIATNGGTLAYQKLAPTRETADKLLDGRLAAPFTADANDFLYQWESSRDYNPSPGLERIQAALLAINSADDERNPPETGIMERELKRVKNGRLYLIPASEDTRGHGTTGMAKFWKQQVGLLLATAPRRAM